MQRLYDAELREPLTWLRGLFRADRSTFAPQAMAIYGQQLDRGLRTILKLLAPGKRTETELERWADPDETPAAADTTDV